jgi:myo-inositol-1(or 4)-monophosphatase
MNQDFHNAFELAQQVIKEAGEKSLTLLNEKPKLVSKEFKHNFVTEVDQQLESFIKEKFESQFPDFGFLGEEGEHKESNVFWIVDPIDGTIAYGNNITSEFGLAIALIENDDVIFSVQYLPVSDKLLTAFKGEGAFENGTKIHVSEKTEFGGPTLISIGHQNFWDDRFIEYTLKLVKQCHNLRVSYSSVVESFYLASGKTDVVIRFNQAVWDVAPEYLLMKEAGAVVTDWYGNPLKMTFTKDSRHEFIATNTVINKNGAELLYIK